MTKNRRETKTARHIQNVFEVPYTAALQTVRKLHHEAYGFSKSGDRPYLDVMERMAAKLLMRRD